MSNDMMRMDVRTQLDFPLVSLLMSDAHLEFVNYRDKKYFSGKPGLRTVDAVVPLEISATDLVAVVLEKPLKNQKCEFQDGNLSQCMGQAGQTPYRVSWTKRDQTGPWYGRAKKMTIQIPQRKINLNFYFTDWQSNLSKVEGLSVLSAPADFQKMNK